MRSILNVSLPADRKKKLAIKAKKLGMTVSAYVLYSVDLVDQLISEQDLLKMAKKAEKDYKNGKTKVLNSFADLM